MRLFFQDTGGNGPSRCKLDTVASVPTLIVAFVLIVGSGNYRF